MKKFCQLSRHMIAVFTLIFSGSTFAKTQIYEARKCDLGTWVEPLSPWKVPEGYSGSNMRAYELSIDSTEWYADSLPALPKAYMKLVDSRPDGFALVLMNSNSIGVYIRGGGGTPLTFSRKDTAFDNRSGTCHFYVALDFKNSTLLGYADTKEELEENLKPKPARQSTKTGALR